MRARHRHINPRQAGATFAWDTRYNIDGHANNGAVGTWTDRGSSTATQGTSGNRPAWKDNQIGGSPAVVFDGSNDYLSTSSISSATEISVMAVGKRPWSTVTKFACIIQTGGYGATAGIGFLTAAAAFNDWQSKDIILAGNGYNSGRNPRAVGPYGSIADGTVSILSGVLSSSASRAWMIGAKISTRVEGTASVPSVSGAAYVGGNTSPADYGDFSFGLLSYWRNVGLSDSLRRRLEHAAAYSFKVACA